MGEDNGTNSGAINFTEGESKLVLAIMQNLTSEIQFDAAAVAAQLGYKNAKVANDLWGRVKKKKLSGAGGAAGSPNSGINKKSGTASKKATKKTNEGENGHDGEEEVVGEGTPSKPPTKRGYKARAEKKEAEAGVKIKAEEGEDVVESEG